MNISTLYKKYKYIILILSVVFLVIVLLLWLMTYSRSKNNTQDKDMPVTSSNSNDKVNNPTSNPKAISTPLPFTGVNTNIDLPKDEIISINQERDLRHLTPFDDENFLVEYNYQDDFFAVTLGEPKEKALQYFIKWRTAKFPNIEQSRFTFK